MRSPKTSEGNEREREVCQRQDKEDQWKILEIELGAQGGPLHRWSYHEDVHDSNLMVHTVKLVHVAALIVTRNEDLSGSSYHSEQAPKHSNWEASHSTAGWPA